jgi:hypothetical protein
LDYQIGDMPGDREKQIIILQKEVEKVRNLACDNTTSVLDY